MGRSRSPPFGPLRAYLINQTVHWFSVGLVFPILILLILDKGLSLFEAGTVLAVYSGTTMLLEIPTGGLADSIGRKKVYMISVAVHMAAAGTMLLSFDLPTVAAAAAVMGAGRALSSGAMDAWFVDEFKAASPDGNLQQALAKVNVFAPLGLGAGSIIGGTLPMTLGTAMSQGWGMSIYSVNLIAVLAVDFTQLLMTQRLIKEAPRHEWGGGVVEGFRKVPSILSSSLSLAFRNRTLSVLLLVMVALGFGIAGLELLWQPRVIELQGSGTETWTLGVLAAAYFLVTAAGSAIVTPLCTWLKGDNVLTMTILTVAMGGAMVVLAFQGTFLMFSTFYLITYLVIGMTNSPYGALYNEEVPGDQRSTMLSVQSLVGQGGGLMGSLALGLLAGHAGIPVAWMVAGAVVAGAAAGFLFLRSQRSGALAGPSGRS